MPHLIFRHGRIRPYVHQQARVTMPERVHARAWILSLSSTGQRPVLNDFVGCIRSPVAIEEEKPLGICFPRRQIFLEHRESASAIATGARLAFALHGLHSCRTMPIAARESRDAQVEVRFLQAHDFSDAKSGHGGNSEHGTVWLRSDP